MMGAARVKGETIRGGEMAEVKLVCMKRWRKRVRKGNVRREKGKGREEGRYEDNENRGREER